jgi:hypothetical protein
MRFAINTIPRKGGRVKATQVCTFVRACKADFELFTPYLRRELRKKQAVTASSLQKIEEAVYAITVRTAEYDLPPDMLDDIAARHMLTITHENRGRREVDDEEDDD